MSFVYFTDRDLGKRFPAILQAAGLAVERHADFFPHDAPDEHWLEYVGQGNRIAVSHDQRIRYKPNELDAVVRHRARLLVVIGKAPYPELARNFVRTVSRVEAFLANRPGPFIAKVYRPTTLESKRDAAAPGSISLWFPP